MADRNDELDQLIYDILEGKGWSTSQMEISAARKLVAQIHQVEENVIDAYVLVAVHHNNGGQHVRVVTTDLDPMDARALLAETVDDIVP